KMSFVKAQKARQKPHRERGQVSGREGLGLLEKKKDYKLRARSYKEKEKQLKALRKIAQSKNPDEFYFGMIKTKLTDGEHVKDFIREEQTATPAQKMLMETQDLNYVKWKLQIEKKKIEKLENRIHFVDGTTNKHIRFIDSNEEIPLEKPKTNTVRISLINEWASMIKEGTASKRLVREIEQRKTRVKELQAVVDKLTIQKILSTDKAVKDRDLVKREDASSAAIYKWKPLRKR
uniref:U3 small nucleolar RNA-associated protein 11 n=1 Tax=Ciona intestinalis TaxID=7719 RepID=H2XWG7_CIOIN